MFFETRVCAWSEWMEKYEKRKSIGSQITRGYQQKIILVGSSYSASLVLKIAKENDKVRAVASFSPGEYFKKKLILSEAIKGLDKPVFVTSSKSETEQVKTVMQHIPASDKVTHFIPKKEGIHGTRALWESTPNQADYWRAFTAFLNTLKN